MTNLLSLFIYFLTRILGYTLKYKYIGTENIDKAIKLSPKKHYIYALWHQELYMALSAHQHDKCAMIVSASKDGQIVARASEKYGHRPIRGSSHRGGLKALISMIKVLKTENYNGAITVDGPKGPAFEVKKGIIEISKKTEFSIVPLACQSTKYWEFKSWDQFRLPKPFSTVLISYGRAILIPNDTTQGDYDRLCQQIKNEINYAHQKLLTS